MREPLVYDGQVLIVELKAADDFSDADSALGLVCFNLQPRQAARAKMTVWTGHWWADKYTMVLER
jgi:hypothetical protein